ncbi:hypothetical protein AB3S75_026574 [Citrus x aurantiifolia]
MPIVFRVHRFTNQGSSLVCGNENDVVLYIQDLRKHTCCKNCKPLVGSFTRRLKNLLEAYFFVPRSIAPHAVYE